MSEQAAVGKGKGGGPVFGEAASRLIDQRIAGLADWRGETLARMRALILAADPGVAEEWKWGVPVWSRGGIVCTGEVYKAVVKLTFARGASVPDPPACSIPASKETCGGRSTSARAKRWTPTPSRP